MPAARHNSWTPERKARFLDHLAGRGNVRAACAAVGLSAEAAYRLRRRDPLFAQAWAAALVLARAHAEQVLADHALNGVAEPIFYRGEQVGARVRFDARLLLAHLARLDRLAEQAEASADAARFDELVAVIAGARIDEGLAEASASDEPAVEDADEAPAAPVLPLPRERYVAAEAERAECAAVRALYEDEEPDEEDGEHAFDDPDEEDGDEEEDADWEDPILAARRVARAEAGARWDRWFARACALVDGLAPTVAHDRGDTVAFVAGATEYKSLAAAPGFASLDPVNRVNPASPGQRSEVSGQYCVPMPSNTRRANFQPASVRFSVSA